MQTLKQRVEQIWQNRGPLSYLLLPLSWIFRCIIYIRRYLYTLSVGNEWPVPVVVVGNISVGGNGKTPCVIALANALIKKGLRPGIVSRGYGVKRIETPRLVVANHSYQMVGDEPLLIAEQTSCPVVVCANRPQAVSYLLSRHDCDVVISDDGLQHYALSRRLEIVMVGSKATIGNGFCLPAGPLREPFSRLKTVDWVLGDKALSCVQYEVKTNIVGLIHLKTGEINDLNILSHRAFYAYAGIAHPARFFTLLENTSIHFTRCIYPDHYAFSLDDFKGREDDFIVMTEKDAIKCREFATDNMYYLRIESELDNQFVEELYGRLVQ